jgi:hypothetical protein
MELAVEITKKENIQIIDDIIHKIEGTIMIDSQLMIYFDWTIFFLRS